MGGSRRKLVLAGLAAGAALLVAGSLLTDGLTAACPAIGYADISPIQLRFELSADVDSVAACFEHGCRPVAVAPDQDGAWSVPQTNEYLQGGSPGSVREVTVTASSDDVVLVNDVFTIEQESAARGGLRRQCPGPVRYLPVQIGASTA